MFLWFSQPLQAVCQEEMIFGFSLNHGFSVLSNKEKMISDKGMGGINESVTSYPIGLWRTSSFIVDSYWKEKKIVASIGFNFFHFKSVSDSVLPDLSNQPYYAQTTNSSTVVLPFVRVAYRFNLGEHLFYQPSFSIGMTEILYRYKRTGAAYNPSEQEVWDKQNSANAGYSWIFDFEKKPFIFEFGNNICYDLNRWSFSGGLSYYFYRNLPIEGYHGLHANIGCSLRFDD